MATIIEDGEVNKIAEKPEQEKEVVEKGKEVVKEIQTDEKMDEKPEKEIIEKGIVKIDENEQKQNKKDPKMHAVIAGASGTVGTLLVKILLESGQVSKVEALVRTKKDAKEHWKIGDENAKKLIQTVVDFDNLQGFSKSATHAFCCLGTTRQKSGKEGFRKVDFDYITRFASKANESGVKNFNLLSSMGASVDSSLLYAQVKGETEEFIKKLGFSTCIIHRPGFFFGKENHDSSWKVMLHHVVPDSMGAQVFGVANSLAQNALQNFGKDVGLKILENKEVKQFEEEKEEKKGNCVIS